MTSAGCQATGVAAGGVTITATVSKGNETANVGSQLTVTAPAAPPPFEASIAPASQSVAVGSSVVFAVNTSGGYTAMMGDMMMAASWTCASSDPAIATVETTDAGCQATGVSGGDVTVNVAATDGHATVNLVAQLTVTTDPVDPVQPFSATKDFCRKFFQWYNTEHRHGGIGLLTPQQVHFGRASEVIEHRQNVLAEAYAARPDRFVGGPPKAVKLPAEVWINRALPLTVDGAEPANGGKEGSLN